MSDPSDLKAIIEDENAELTSVAHEEVRRERSSLYWRGPLEPHIASDEDYDQKKMVEDYAKRFPHLHPDAIANAVWFAIYHEHLR